MEAKPYPEDKRRDLIKRSKDDFIAFLEGVTEREGKRFIQQKLLPSKVKGFRPGHAQLTLTVPRLINDLKKEQELTNSNSVIWNMFKTAWTAWVESHHELNKLLLEFDNASDFDENHKCVVPPNSELDIQCFKTLLKASHNYQIDQGTIRRFYEYGYFLPSDEIETLIEKALPEAEMERQQRLAALPGQVDKLSEAIDLLNSRLSAIESTDEAMQKLDQKIAEAIKPFESQFSKSKASFNSRVGQLKQSINSRLSNVEESVKSLENQVSDTEFVKNIALQISQLDQVTKKISKSFQARLDEIQKTITEMKTDREEQHRMTDAPQIAHQAVHIGERFSSQLTEDADHYSDEEAYLSDFEYCLKRFGITNSDETATAIHVALKAFPALEVADTRIIEVWRLMCDNHSHLTNIDVEMGWLGLQDWFPELFSQECFGEQFRTMDLGISVRKMLEMGGMLWAIHFSGCDRSFPDGYLPRFLDWIGDFSDGGIRVFLTRCSGINRCETNPDVYARIACLPKPQEPEPIEAQNLRPSGFIVTRSEWESWCRPNPDANQLPLLNQLQEVIENKGMQIPTVLLREILHYCRLSHGLLTPSRSLDWALTLRLLPWIENRRELIDTVQKLMDQENREFTNFQKGLQHSSSEEKE